MSVKAPNVKTAEPELFSVKAVALLSVKPAPATVKAPAEVSLTVNEVAVEAVKPVPPIATPLKDEVESLMTKAPVVASTKVGTAILPAPLPVTLIVARTELVMLVADKAAAPLPVVFKVKVARLASEKVPTVKPPVALPVVIFTTTADGPAVRVGFTVARPVLTLVSLMVNVPATVDVTPMVSVSATVCVPEMFTVAKLEPTKFPVVLISAAVGELLLKFNVDSALSVPPPIVTISPAAEPVVPVALKVADVNEVLVIAPTVVVPLIAVLTLNVAVSRLLSVIAPVVSESAETVAVELLFTTKDVASLALVVVAALTKLIVFVAAPVAPDGA